MGDSEIQGIRRQESGDKNQDMRSKIENLIAGIYHPARHRGATSINPVPRTFYFLLFT